MSKIYRIEHRHSGKGPYSGGLVKCPNGDRLRITDFIQDKTGFDLWGTDCARDDDLHPSPLDDTLLRDFWYNCPSPSREEYYFGFESMESLIRWFSDIPEVYEILKEHDYILAIYKGDAVRGETQAVFKPEECDRIATKELDFDKFSDIY